MSSFTNNGTFQTLFRQGDGREQSNYYTLASRQQNAPVIGNSSCSEFHWSGEPLRESYMPTDNAPNTNSWQSAASPSLASSVYGGGVCDPRHNEARLGSSFDIPRDNAEIMNLMRMGVAPPVLGQTFPAASALPAFQPRPLPSLNWPQAPGPPWQPISPDYPVHTARQHNGHSNSISSLAVRPGGSSFQLTAPSEIAGSSERRFMPTGSLPSTTTPKSVQPSTFSDPAPVAPFRPRGERWELSNETVFQCQWTSQCAALMAGNRRSVTNHLRDKHDFTCNDQMVACTWGECSTRMQRRNLPRHVVACHFAVKVTCPRCGLALSRADANKKHRLACTGASKTPAIVEATEEDESGYFWRS